MLGPWNFHPIEKEKERKVKRSRAWKTHNVVGDTIIRATNQYAQGKKQTTVLAIDHVHTLFPRSSNRSVSMFCPACPLVYYYLFSLTSSLFTVHISPFVSDESVSSFSTCYDIYIYLYIYIEVEQPPKLCMHEKRMLVSPKKVISIMWNVTTNTNDKLKCSKRLHFKSQKADY